MRAPVLLLLPLAPLAAGAHGDLGHAVGLVTAERDLCAGLALANLAYDAGQERPTLTLTLHGEACGLPRVTTFSFCGEGDEPGLMWPSHIWCSAAADVPTRAWLGSDGDFTARWGDVWMEGAWTSDGRALARLDALLRAP